MTESIQEHAEKGKKKLAVLDLFSGIGGFSLGLERTGGFETVAFCEIEPFCRRVLAKHWPEVPVHGDVATVEPVGPVDVVAAGFPCQDISFIGEGAGLTGTRSGLFWHILRTVRMVGQPQLLLENVAALLNRGLDAVLGALAEIGYDAEWHCIPASAVGAPHRRDRIWIVAHPDQQRGRRERQFSGSFGAWTRDKLAGSDWWASEPDVGRVAHGVPARVDRLQSLGNAVVPQIPELIGRAILESRRAAA